MNKLREKYRLEWENIVITLINGGMGLGSAQMEADRRIEDNHYDELTEDEDLYEDEED